MPHQRADRRGARCTEHRLHRRGGDSFRTCDTTEAEHAQVGEIDQQVQPAIATKLNTKMRGIIRRASFTSAVRTRFTPAP